MQPNKTSEQVRAAIVQDLEAANPLTGKEIAAKHGVHPSTVSRVRERYAIQITATKKITPPAADASPSGFRAKARKTINASFDALDDKKLKKASAGSLAIIIGILRDKIRDLDAKTEESITIRFGDRKAMLSFLSGKDAEPGDPAPAAIPATAEPTGEPEPPI